jgi:hypothetical protein
MDVLSSLYMFHCCILRDPHRSGYQLYLDVDEAIGVSCLPGRCVGPKLLNTMDLDGGWESVVLF